MTNTCVRVLAGSVVIALWAPAWGQGFADTQRQYDQQRREQQERDREEQRKRDRQRDEDHQELADTEWDQMAARQSTERPWTTLGPERSRMVFGACSVKSPSDPGLSWFLGGAVR